MSCAVFLYVVAPYAEAAELFKCRSANGQTLYSDTACDKSGASQIGKIVITPNPAEEAAGSPAAASGAAPTNARQASGSADRRAAKNTPKDPEARRARERELTPILESTASTLEQKAAAQEELSSLASMGVCKLSDEERKRRDEAYAELGGDVRPARLTARRALRQILSACERG